MKKFLTFLLILYPLIIIGCKTTKQAEQVEIVLPPKPQRETLKNPQNIQDCAEIIAYYEGLVCEWELWGEQAENAINKAR